MDRSKPVVTITINPAIDQTITIPNFSAGTVNRVHTSRIDAGGKGINVASFLVDYGQPATVTGFLGADNDDLFCRWFEQKGILDRCIRIAGKTRIGIKICDEALHQTTDINFPGETPSPGDIQRLLGILSDLASEHEWFIFSGSIPPGVSPGIYQEMLQGLAGKRVVLDTSGVGFRQALAARPWLIKPNVDELSEFAGKPLNSPSAIIEQALDLMKTYRIPCVVVSMGRDGAIFLEGDRIVWAVPPETEVKSTVGAGDAMVAGIVAGKVRGLDLLQCARLATAFSVAAISHIGRGLSSIEAVQIAEKSVTVREISSAVV